MAEWIKVELHLPEKPEVLQIAEATKMDTNAVLSQQIVEPWKTIAAKLALALIGSSREFSQKALDEYQTMLNGEIFQKKEDA